MAFLATRLTEISIDKEHHLPRKKEQLSILRVIKHFVAGQLSNPEATFSPPSTYELAGAANALGF